MNLIKKLKLILAIHLFLASQTFASGLTFGPTMIASGLVALPFDGGETMKEMTDCRGGKFPIWLFLFPFCELLDIGEIQLIAQDEYFNRPISEFDRSRLIETLQEVRKAIPKVAELPDSEIIKELAFADIQYSQNKP